MKNALGLTVFLIALLVCVYAVQLMTPIVGDYFSFFRPTTIAFLRGETNLYDASSPGFFNAPWSLAIWLPFVSYPYAIGQSAHELLYILFVLISLALLRNGAPRSGVLFAVFNLPALALLVAAGIDSFILLGVALLYVGTQRRQTGLMAVALLILANKPQNVALVIALCLFASGIWKAILLPISAAIISALFIGLDWPLRYLSYIQSYPPLAERRIELWKFAPPVALIAVGLVVLVALVYIIRREGFSERAFSLALTTNLVFSPYVLWSHFVLLVPVVLFLSRRDWRLAALVWLSSWLIPQFGMIYPIVALAILFALPSIERFMPAPRIQRPRTIPPVM